MSKKTIILIVIIAAITLISGWAFVVSSNITRDIKKKESQNTFEEDQTSVEELVITETREGQKFWEVYAESGQYDSSRSTAKLSNVKGNFYRNKKVVLSFDAPSAIYTAKNKEIRLIGGSRAATDSSILITSNELNWAGNRDKITAIGHVKIKRADQIMITSDRSDFSTDFKKISVSGDSKTNVYRKN